MVRHGCWSLMGEFPMSRGRRKLGGRRWAPADGDEWKTTVRCQDSGTPPQPDANVPAIGAAAN